MRFKRLSFIFKIEKFNSCCLKLKKAKEQSCASSKVNTSFKLQVTKVNFHFLKN